MRHVALYMIRDALGDATAASQWRAGECGPPRRLWL